MALNLDQEGTIVLKSYWEVEAAVRQLSALRENEGGKTEQQQIAP